MSCTRRTNKATIVSAAIMFLMIVSLAGCIGDDAEPAEAGDLNTTIDTTPTGPKFANGTAAPRITTLYNCYEQVGSLAAPAEAYEDRLPDGFSLVPYSALGEIPPEPTGMTAEILVVGSECAHEDGTTLQRTTVFLFVDPPSQWQNPDADFGHLLILSYITTSTQNKETFEAWGLGPAVSEGDVTFEQSQVPVAHIARASATAGDATVEIDTAVAGVPLEMDGSTVRFYVADENAEVTGAADASFGSFDALAGNVRVSGSEQSGLWQDVSTQTGIGLHIWGHNNVWSWVDLYDETVATPNTYSAETTRP